MALSRTGRIVAAILAVTTGLAVGLAIHKHGEVHRKARPAHGGRWQMLVLGGQEDSLSAWAH